MRCRKGRIRCEVFWRAGTQEEEGRRRRPCGSRTWTDPAGGAVLCVRAVRLRVDLRAALQVRTGPAASIIPNLIGAIEQFEGQVILLDKYGGTSYMDYFTRSPVRDFRIGRDPPPNEGLALPVQYA